MTKERSYETEMSFIRKAIFVLLMAVVAVLVMLAYTISDLIQLQKELEFLNELKP